MVQRLAQEKAEALQVMVVMVAVVMTVALHR